jgi:predicted regulator of Ras-like GTPase activity (Roadblock/LC7/MglB family)
MSANRAAVAGPRLQLPLLVVLRGIPSAQISGPTDEVPESAQIDVSLSIIQAQLASGKISLSPAQFVAALPAEFRGRLKLEDSQTPIPLPLEEVLQRLPNDALRVRTDQEAPEPMTAFETPFSQKAAEDAARFQSPSTDAVVQVAPETPENLESNEESTATNDQDNAITDVSSSAADAKPMPLKPVLKITPEKTLLPGTSATSKPSESATPAPQPVERTPLQKIFETDEVLDPKSIVSHIGRLSGVRACAIMFSDGLSLADNFPPEYTTDALCAIAPTVVQKIGAQIPGAKLGALKSVTLFCAKEPVSFFAHETICLAALHAGANEMTSETRASLNAVVEELARIYTAQPNDVNQPNA